MGTIMNISFDQKRAMGNCGFKSLGWHPFGGLPQIVNRRNLKVVGLSAEHTKIESINSNDDEKIKIENLKWGDKI